MLWPWQKKPVVPKIGISLLSELTGEEKAIAEKAMDSFIGNKDFVQWYDIRIGGTKGNSVVANLIHITNKQADCVGILALSVRREVSENKYESHTFLQFALTDFDYYMLESARVLHKENKVLQEKARMQQIADQERLAAFEQAKLIMEV